MKIRPRIVMIALLVAVVGGTVWQRWRALEPVCQGKKLTVWLDQYGTNYWLVSQAAWASQGGVLAKQAETAIKEIGAKANPICLKMISAKDSPLKLRLMSLVPKPWLALLPARRAPEARMLGAYGLVALGAEAKPAVPALIDLLNDSDDDVRRKAVFTLDGLGPAAGDAVPSLVKRLDDPNGTVLALVITSLGDIHQEPGLVVPVLVGLLDNPQFHRFRYLIIRALGQFGTQAKSAVAALRRYMNDAEEAYRLNATNALDKIDPGAAAYPGN